MTPGGWFVMVVAVGGVTGLIAVVHLQGDRHARLPEASAHARPTSRRRTWKKTNCAGCWTLSTSAPASRAVRRRRTLTGRSI